MNPFSLAGKTALVAGASRGIGLAIAREMAAAGAQVIPDTNLDGIVRLTQIVGGRMIARPGRKDRQHRQPHVTARTALPSWLPA